MTNPAYPSQLRSAADGQSGGIGCIVQDSAATQSQNCTLGYGESSCRLNGSAWEYWRDWVSWVITGFTEIPSGATITIKGKAESEWMEYPENLVEDYFVITYDGCHPTDVFHFGDVIGLSKLNTNAPTNNTQLISESVDTTLTLKPYKLLRSGHRGPLTF